jgi:hypothetical protein
MIAPSPVGDASFHGVQRRLAALLPTESWLENPAPLELTTLGVQDTPRLIAASILEGKTLREHQVIGAPEVRFAAFLDGTQTSRVIAHVDGIPIVYATVASVVRQRIDRRMRTWETPRLRRGLYTPLALLPEAWRNALATAQLSVVDTLERRKPDSSHPFALQDAAIHAVQDDREALELELAELWCDRVREPNAGARGELFVDGAITGSEMVATAPNVVGVIKSHRTLYAEGDALRSVLRLPRGHRTSVFRITSPRRTPVASWYLRLREPIGRDPLWGLVRVEVAEERGASARKVGTRANEVSRWVLAETLPLAVPDGRWDKMVYGIRDCEEFLRAIQ